MSDLAVITYDDPDQAGCARETLRSVQWGDHPGIVVIRYPLWVAAIIPPALSFMVGITAIVIGVVGLEGALQGGSLGVGLLGFLSVVIGLPFIFGPPEGARQSWHR